ncbi:hypothetical protein HMPREF0262_02617 [Clostridium sp. ATCC 29733]|nr:hypothetical protein HMPREF0262_02617 [Clostridium sp. ATCC 29733]
MDAPSDLVGGGVPFCPENPPQKAAVGASPLLLPAGPIPPSDISSSAALPALFRLPACPLCRLARPLHLSVPPSSAQ